jgi:hypothetical protein
MILSTTAKIVAQFRVKRALYRRKHGPSLPIGEDANAIYDYVAIASATSALHEAIWCATTAVSRPSLEI